MFIKAKHIQYIIILLVPILLGTFTYMINLIIIPGQALKNINYWPYYITNYAFFRVIFFMPAIWLYPFIFKKNTLFNKLAGFIYAVAFALFYSRYVFSNDPRMSLAIADTFIMPITYTLTAISIYFIYEFFAENRRN